MKTDNFKNIVIGSYEAAPKIDAAELHKDSSRNAVKDLVMIFFL